MKRAYIFISSETGRIMCYEDKDNASLARHWGSKLSEKYNCAVSVYRLVDEFVGGTSRTAELAAEEFQERALDPDQQRYRDEWFATHPPRPAPATDDESQGDACPRCDGRGYIRGGVARMLTFPCPQCKPGKRPVSTDK